MDLKDPTQKKMAIAAAALVGLAAAGYLIFGKRSSSKRVDTHDPEDDLMNQRAGQEIKKSIGHAYMFKRAGTFRGQVVIEDDKIPEDQFHEIQEIVQHYLTVIGYDSRINN